MRQVPQETERSNDRHKNGVAGRLSTSERGELKRRLLQKRQQLLDDLEMLGKEALGDRARPEGVACDAGIGPDDLSTYTEIVDTDLGLYESELERLARVQEALDRLSNGAYGVCPRCGRAIAKRRLRAMPWVSHCRPCAEELERQTDGRMHGH